MPGIRVVNRALSVLAAALLLGAGVVPAVAAQVSATFEQAATARDDWRADSDAYIELSRRAEDEPAGARLAVPGLAGVDSGVPAAGDPAGENAQLGLDAAIDLAIAADPGAALPESPEPSPTARLRAQRHYVAGMSMRTAGDNTAAAEEFAAAARLDPGAPGPWLRLAEAQARSGEGAASLLSRRRAADLGDNTPVSLYILGTHTARISRDEEAAHFFARCLRHRPDRIDPLLGDVTRVRLGDVLIRLGYLRAGVEAGVEGFRGLEGAPGVSSRFGGEVNEILRDAAGHWLRIADAATRIGEPEIAAEAYARAASGAEAGSGPAFAQRASGLAAHGKAAGLAVLVLDHATERDGYFGRLELRIIEAVAADVQVAPLLMDAIEDLDAAGMVSGAIPSAVRSRVLARAMLMPRDQVASMLMEEDTGVLGRPLGLDVLMRSLNDPAARMRAAVGIVEAAPSAARAVAESLLRWHPSPLPAVEALDDGDAGRLLRAEYLVLAGQTVRVLDSGVGLGDASAAEVSVRGRAAAIAGDWPAFDASVAALTSTPVEQARVLLEGQRFTEGLDALEPVLGADAPLDALVLGADLAVASGAAARAEEFLARAIGEDPYDETLYEQLIGVYRRFGDGPRVAEAEQMLGQRLPASWFAGWLDAQRSLRLGRDTEAERRFRELAEAAPWRGEALEVLVQLWSRRINSKGAGSVADAERWLAERTGRMPSLQWHVARARLALQSDEPDQAEGMLRQAMDTHGTVSVSRVLEQAARARGDLEGADAIASARHAEAGAGVETGLDWAESLARSGRWGRVGAELRSALADGPTLTVTQRGRIVALLSAMASRMESGLDENGRVAMRDLIGVADSRGVVLPWQLWSLRWTLLASDPAASDGEIVQSARRFLEAIDSMEAVQSLVGQTAMPDPVPIETIEQGRGAVAYLLGNSLQADGREVASLETLRLALEYYPEHAWAANDLGYFLVERGESLDEAEALLERAYALKPSQASIADSLAWLRYRQGHMDDIPLEDATTKPGAVTLLRAAVGLPGGRANPTIHEHLGDALWRAGERDRANAAWIRAQQLLFERLVNLRDGGRSAARDQLTEQATRVGAKVDAVREGEEPATAPLISER